ncbi:MAG: LysR substrate-binding domain-containing protein [Phenylobacterium sp.]|uniref:LysR family transcriptional regulator n=1 Tax=Phenylobacterium sp. TaxID=1871053 RepID=UPI002733E31B|nr:LysR substrate-binding domain-containing protein [Phenylobacterium sp.]MDP3746544.1 LysR substrate-binding domain-containing protein [Phenylobacterium sp.]
MTLVQLANFIRIAELQSLSKAAAVIRIAQPALSRQLRHLETELGTALLLRHARGVSLTSAGEAFLARARRVLAEADGARDAVNALAANPTGRVVLGVPTSLATVLLPALAAVLREKYPKLRPRLVDGFSAVLHARTIAGELDLAALYDDRAVGPLATSPLLDEDLVLVGPSDVLIPPGPSVRVMAQSPLILPARPNRLRLIVDAGLSAEILHEADIVEVDSLPAIIAMVSQGMGFTVLPQSSVASELAAGRLQTWPLAPKLTRTLLLVRPVDRQPSAAVTAVEFEVRALVRDLGPKVGWRPLGTLG